jgi:hypothetical protein
VVKPAEHNSIQLVWFWEMRIDGKEIAYQLARHGSSLPLQYLSLPLAYLQRLPGE